MKKFTDKKEYFSLRKFKRGLASVTIGATLFISVNAVDIAVNSQQLTVQAATVSDYNNFNARWSLTDQIVDNSTIAQAFQNKAYSTAKTSILRNNGTTVDVTVSVAPLSGNAVGMSFLTDGANQSSYMAIASQFAGNPNPAAIPALGIYTHSPKSTATTLDDIKAKLNANGSTEMSTITYTFSEPVTDPILDLSGIGGYSEISSDRGGARGSFNNTIIELVSSDQPATLTGLTTTNLTVSDTTVRVTDRNTYFRSVLDGDYGNPGTPLQTPKLVPAGTGTVQISGTVTTVTFKLSHDAVPYSVFSSEKYGTGSAYFDNRIDATTSGFYTDGINGANKFWGDFQSYGFGTNFYNDDLFRMSVRLPDVGNVTVEHQIIDANGNVIGTLEEKSSVKTNETVGVAYTTTPLEGDKLVKDGKTYEYVKVADTSAPTNGEVKTATQHVIYQYREVKGGEVVEKHVIEGTDTELVAADGTPTAATVKEAGTPLDEAFSTQPKADLLYDAQGNAYKSNGDTDGKDNNATGKVTADKQTVTFEYVPVKGSVTVNYVDEAGNPIPGVDPKTVKDNEPVTKDGNKYDTTTEDFRPKTVTATDGTEYELVAETPKDGSADPTGTVEEGTKNVTYVYRKVVKGGEVVEKHVIEGTDTELVAADGTPTAATVKEAGTPLDEAFSTQPKADLLYDAQGNAYKSNGDTDGKDNNATGKVTADKQTVTFEYVPVKGSVTVNYVDEAGNPIPGVDPKTVKDNEPVTKDGNKYDTTTEDFRPKTVTATDGTEYELVAETPKDGSADPTGTVEEGTKNVTYVYRKVVKTG
ncbi:MucBP domain-containing protein, partial [Streptococcus suis]|nr:MucBP domain-containing protein [Streptococcus suis]